MSSKYESVELVEQILVPRQDHRLPARAKRMRYSRIYGLLVRVRPRALRTFECPLLCEEEATLAEGRLDDRSHGREVRVLDPSSYVALMPELAPSHHELSGRQEVAVVHEDLALCLVPLRSR